MKISGCSNCGTRFSGLRCPKCGRPLPIVGALIVLIGTGLTLFFLAMLFPEEEVPRAKEVVGGAIEYCFQSLFEAIVLPVGLVLVITFLTLSCVIFKTRKIPKESPQSFPGAWGFALRVAKWLRYAFVACLLLMAAVLLLYMIIVMPLTDVRCVVVDQETVEFRAALRSWSLPRARIKRAEFLRENVVRKRQPRVDVSFVIEDDRHHTYNTFQLSFEPTDPDLKKYTTVFEKLERHLNEQEN